MRQRRNRDRARWQFVDAFGASERVATTNVHRTRPAHAFPARAAKRQRRIHIVLDGDQRIENHRATGGEIEFVSIPRRVFAGLRIVPVNLELADFLGPGRRLVALARFDLGVLRQREFDHGSAYLTSADARVKHANCPRFVRWLRKRPGRTNRSAGWRSWWRR